MSEKEVKSNKPRLSRVFILWSVIFITILCVVLTIIGVGVYRKDMYNRYYEYADALTRLSQKQFDGEDVKACISSGQMSEKMQTGLDEMNRIKDASEVAYMYILYYPNQSDKGDMRYVLYANTESDRKQGIADSTIGEKCGDEYTKDIWDAFYRAQFSKDEKDHVGYVVNQYQGIGKAQLVMTAYRPVYDKDGNVVCIIGSDIFMSLIYNSILRYILMVAICGIVLMLLCMFGLSSIISKNIINPIVMLASSAKNFVNQANNTENPNELDFQVVEVEKDNEIRDLSNDLTAMTERLKDYMLNLQEVTKEKERIGAELDVATKIQASALPNIFPAYPERKEFDLFASMDPAKEVGGDFYDFYMLDDDHLGIVIADVSGKGVPAALFMMASKIMLKQQASICMEPEEILTKVNNQLCENNEADMFVTVWFAILEISTGKIKAANAGHEYPAICRANGEFELFKDKHGFVLAGMEDFPYTQYEMQLEPGDRLFVYTDGVPEATNAENELYGTDRMLEALNKEQGIEPKQLLSNVRTSVDAFVKDAPQFDDLTMLSLTYLGSQNS